MLYVEYIEYIINYATVIKQITTILTSFDIEFQPFIAEINTKEKIIRKYADSATMERIRSMVLHMVLDNRAESNVTIQASKESFRILRQS